MYHCSGRLNGEDDQRHELGFLRKELITVVTIAKIQHTEYALKVRTLNDIYIHASDAHMRRALEKMLGNVVQNKLHLFAY